MRRFFRISRWALLTALLVFCLVVAFVPIPMPSLAGSSGKTYPELAPPPSFAISEETTVLTEPLGPDGYVNYVAAANQQYGEGVTPDNNAVIPLLEAVGFKYLTAVSHDRYFELLGTPPPELLDEVFVSFKTMADDYVEEHEDAYLQELESDTSEREFFETDEGYVLSTRDMSKKHPRRAIEYALRQAQNRPWSREEFPEIADWLAQNRESLDHIVQASERTRYFAPLLGSSPGDENVPFISVFLGVSGNVSEAGKALYARALLRIGQGQMDEARQDLVALHRLSRLVGQEPTLVSRMISYSLELGTLDAMAHLVASDEFTSEHAERMLTDLQSLAPIAGIESLLHGTERYSVLDWIGWMAREATVPEPGIVSRATHPFISAMINWDIPFNCANEWFDVLEEAAAKPTFAERMAAFEQFDLDLKRMTEECSDAPSIMGSLLSGRSPRAEVSWFLGQRICTLMLPDVRGCLLAEPWARAVARLNLLGAALAVFRAEHDQWPETLEELVPEYLEELPSDPYADAPFHYQKVGEGFLLYSVGPNMEDDQGMDGEFDEDESSPLGSEQVGDDICLRVTRQ